MHINSRLLERVEYFTNYDYMLLFDFCLIQCFENMGIFIYDTNLPYQIMGIGKIRIG
jgi:hypothetical protein